MNELDCNQMTRAKLERELLDAMKKVVELYHVYNPEGTYLSLCYINGNIHINNQYFDTDMRKPVDANMINHHECGWSEYIDGKYTFFKVQKPQANG